MSKYMQGWGMIISDLRKNVLRVAPEIHITEISVGQFGQLQFYYSTKNVDNKAAALVDSMVRRAEAIAAETCIVCGDYGRLSYIAKPPMSRVFCEKHKPTDWNEL